MKTESLIAIENNIRTRYSEANHLACQAKTIARTAVLKMAEVGEYIQMGKEQVKDKREWMATLEIDQKVAEKAIQLAKNKDQLQLELWPSDVAKMGAQVVGILPPHISQTRSENDPQRTTDSNNHWMTLARKLSVSLTQLLKERPIKAWREDEKKVIKNAMQPFFELYNKIND